jgi:hypothetical protein
MTIYIHKQIAIGKAVRQVDFFNDKGIKIESYLLPNGLTQLSTALVFNTHRGYVKPFVGTLMAQVCWKEGIEFALSGANVVLKTTDFELIRPRLLLAVAAVSESMDRFVAAYTEAKQHPDKKNWPTCTCSDLIPYATTSVLFFSDCVMAAQRFFSSGFGGEIPGVNEHICQKDVVNPSPGSVQPPSGSVRQNIPKRFLGEGGRL